MFVGGSDQFVHEIDHPLVGFMGGDAVNSNVVVAPIDFVRQAFILVGQAEIATLRALGAIEDEVSNNPYVRNVREEAS